MPLHREFLVGSGRSPRRRDGRKGRGRVVSDLVVTVPKWFWPEWIAEGDAVGEPYTGEEWGFFLGGARPDIKPGERLYIVAHNRVRGYAPVTQVVFAPGPRTIGRRGGAVAVTIPQIVKGFQGWRRRWWNLCEEQPFPNWKNEGINIAVVKGRYARIVPKQIDLFNGRGAS